MTRYDIIRNFDGQHIGEIELSSEEFEDYTEQVQGSFGVEDYSELADVVGPTRPILYEGVDDTESVFLREVE